MSEYQYYDFYAIDKALSPAQRKKIETYSSRSSPSARRATFVYNYSNFRYEPAAVLYDFFDIAIYVANWGSRRLLMKFPANRVDFKLLQAYNYAYDGGGYDEYVKIYKKGKFVMIDLYANIEDSDWVEGEGLLDTFVSLREQILNGDYRVLYLAWLHFSTLSFMFKDDDDWEEDEEEDLQEPPVPANLKKLDKSLRDFVNYWEIDEDIIASAKQRSKAETVSKSTDLTKFISKLSAKEKNDYLVLLLSDENQAQYDLKKRLQEFVPKETKKKTKETKKKTKETRRTVAEIVANSSKEEEKRIKKAKKAADKAQIKKMEEIGKEQSIMWKEVKRNAEFKTGKGYEKATAFLKDLKTYSVYAKEEKKFEKKLAAILEAYGKSLAFRRRLSKNEII